MSGKLPEWEHNNPDFTPWEEEEEEIPAEEIEEIEEDLQVLEREASKRFSSFHR